MAQTNGVAAAFTFGDAAINATLAGRVIAITRFPSMTRLRHAK